MDGAARPVRARGGRLPERPDGRGVVGTRAAGPAGQARRSPAGDGHAGGAGRAVLPCAPAAPGATCHGTAGSRRAARSTTSSAASNAMAFGRRSRRPWSRPSGAGKDARRSPPPASSTARPPGRLKGGRRADPVGYDAGKRTKGRKRHLLTERWLAAAGGGPLGRHPGPRRRGSRARRTARALPAHRAGLG